MTPRTHHYGAALFGVAFLGLSACDSQASTDYQGEALLTLRGSVEIGETSLEGPLVPALVFMGPPGSNEMHFLDVEVEGEFPTAFTLRVRQPPPAAAIQEDSDGVRGAGGYITAVPREHASVIVVAGEGHTRFDGYQEGQVRVLRGWCLQEETECFSEVWLCPSHDFDEAACSLTESMGNPAFKDDPWDNFAGLSENYMVSYLDRAVPGTHRTASLLGADDGLAAGYHLMTFRANTPEERDAWSVCVDNAAVLALQRYNEAHGLNLQASDLALGDCTQHPGIPSCNEQTHHEHWMLKQAAEAELDCGLDEFTIIRIEDPAAEELSVRLGTNVQFTGF